MRNAVSAPPASRPTTPAAPHMPKPGPALPAFSRISALASSSSWRMSVVLSFASCFNSSPIGCSRSSLWCTSLDATRTAAPGLRRRVAHRVRGRQAAVPVRVRVVPACARRLRESRREEAEHGAGARDEPRPLAGDALNVAQDPVAVRLVEIAAEALRAVGDRLEHLRLLLLLIAAELLRRLPECRARLRHLVARLGRPRVDLLPNALARVLLRLGRLLLDLLRAFADALLHLFAHAAPSISSLIA